MALDKIGKLGANASLNLNPGRRAFAQWARSSVLLPLVLLAACNSDPYSGKNSLDDVSTSNNPAEQKPKNPANLILIKDQNYFVEGQPGSVSLDLRLEQGAPLVSFLGLPKAAVWDPAKKEIRWTPEYNDGTDPSNPNLRIRVYPIEITLRSSANQLQKTTKNIVFLVSHVLAPVQINGFEVGAVMAEGATYTGSFTVDSKESPKGRMYVDAAQLPEGLSIAPDPKDPTKFNVKYKPEFSYVKRREAFSNCPDPANPSGAQVLCKELSWNLAVKDEAGSEISLPVKWKVLDVRQKPIVILPELPIKLASLGQDVEMDVIVQDPNGEAVPPRVSILKPSSTKGVFRVQNLGRPSSSPEVANSSGAISNRFRILWDSIPPNSTSERERFTLKVCVWGPKDMDNCLEKTIEVVAPAPSP